MANAVTQTKDDCKATWHLFVCTTNGICLIVVKQIALFLAMTV